MKKETSIAIALALCLLANLNVEAETYYISTPEEWNELAAVATSATVYSEDDVFFITADLDFPAAGVSITPFVYFVGELDGQGHTITVDYTAAAALYGALMRYCGTSSYSVYIHDFTLDGKYASKYLSAAAVAGHMYGTAKNIICDVDITTITSTGNSTGYIGGLFYKLHDGVTLECCGFTGTITGEEDYIGGISSTVDSSGSVTLTGCYNTGDISGEDYVGGFLSMSSVQTYTMTLKFDNCYNSGTISGTGDYVGGFIGRETSSSPTHIFTNCYNTGDVTASGNYAGGFVGYSKSGLEFTNCYNTGDIESSEYAGGLVGYEASTATATFTRCFNAGNVKATESSSTGKAGGILGLSYKTVITDCYNVGDVSGYYVGGLAGSLSTSYSSTISNVYSTGVVTATSSKYTGTLFGCTSATSSSSYISISNAYALEDVALSDGVDADDVTNLSRSALATQEMGDSWTAGDSYTYPRITAIADNDAAKAYAVVVIPAGSDTYESITQDFYVGSIDGVTWTADPEVVDVSGNDAVFNTSYSGTLVMTATCGDYSVDYTLTVSGVTVAGPLYISTPAEWNEYASNSSSYSSSDAFQITTDLDFPSAGLTIVPFSSFSGEMDGDGHTVTIDYTTSAEQSGALFGAVTGSIHDFNVAGSFTANHAYCGPVAGIADGSASVSDIISSVAVTATAQYAGGVVGYASGDGTTLNGLGFTGTLTSTADYAAGVCAGAYGISSLTGCYNAGAISGSSYVGGIAGYTTSPVSKCFNVGAVTASSTYAGGIAGAATGALTDVYSNGDVSGVNYVGGLVGSASGSLANAYSSGYVSAEGSDASNLAVGVTAINSYYLEPNKLSGESGTDTALGYADLAALEPSTLGDNWTTMDDLSYPMLSDFASNDYAKAYSAAVVPSLTGITYKTMTGSVYVSLGGVGDGVTWTSSNTDYFYTATHANSDGSSELRGYFCEGSYTVYATATSGEVSASTELMCVITTGVDDAGNRASVCKDLVSERYYTIAGQRVTGPDESSRSIYIVVREFSDGSAEVVKEVR